MKPNVKKTQMAVASVPFGVVWFLASQPHATVMQIKAAKFDAVVYTSLTDCGMRDKIAECF